MSNLPPLPGEATEPDSDDWLSNLADITTSSDLVAIAKTAAASGASRATKARKPKAKRIAGETHDFRELPTMKQHAPRQSPFYGAQPVYRRYQASQLTKAHYEPQHLLGMEPFLPAFGHLHMCHGDWL